MYAFMYIVKCNDESYYTGSTKKFIFDRIAEHNAGAGANYTRKRRPVVLVYFEEFSSITSAFQREKQIQNWSRAKKEALIARNIDRLKHLAQCRNEVITYNQRKKLNSMPQLAMLN